MVELLKCRRFVWDLNNHIEIKTRRVSFSVESVIKFFLFFYVYSSIIQTNTLNDQLQFMAEIAMQTPIQYKMFNALLWQLLRANYYCKASNVDWHF